MLCIKINALRVWLWYWDKDGKFAFDKPLLIDMPEYSVEFTLIEDTYSTKEKPRKIISEVAAKITLKVSDSKLEDGLNYKSKDAHEYAKQKITTIISESVNTFILKAKLLCKIDSIDFQTFTSYYDLFENFLHGHNVEWSNDSTNYTPFYMLKNKSRKINPRYKRENLLDTNKWNLLINKINSISLPSQEITELYRIKDKLLYNDLKIPLVEAITIIEIFINNKMILISAKKGIEQKTLSGLKKDISFSVLLNILLPLNITPKENRIYGNDIKNIDNLRKIRNKIMHENLSNDRIDKKVTERGIESGIKLLKFLEKKFK